MKKLILSADELCVESFATGTAEPANGTVYGAARSFPATGCLACGTVMRMTCFAGCSEEGCRDAVNRA